MLKQTAATVRCYEKAVSLDEKHCFVIEKVCLDCCTCVHVSVNLMTISSASLRLWILFLCVLKLVQKTIECCCDDTSPTHTHTHSLDSFAT